MFFYKKPIYIENMRPKSGRNKQTFQESQAGLASTVNLKKLLLHESFD